MLRSLPGSRKSDGPRAPDQPHDELAELVASVERGDRAALRTFLSAIVPHLLRVVRRVLGPGHLDVEDVAQEAAFAVVDALPRFRGEGTVLHFACRTAVLTAMNARRRDHTRKRDRVRDALDIDSLATGEPNPEARAVQGSLAPIVRQLLDVLPESMAEALALHAVLGYTVAEIAETAGIPHETVRSRLRLAKRALRKHILADGLLREVAEVDE
jgi:RNA polymerase sigma-70 factor (ECF subfamily)